MKLRGSLLLLVAISVGSIGLTGPDANAGRSEIESEALADCLAERTLRLNKEALLQSTANLSDVKAGYLPTLTAADSVSHESSAGNSMSNNALSVSVSQKIFDASLNSAIDAGESSVKAEKFNLREQTLADSIEAIQSLASLQTLESQITFLQNQTQSYNALVSVLKVGNKIGISDSNDLLQAQATVLANQSQLKQLEFERQNSTASFKAKFGFNPPLLKQFAFKQDPKIEIERLPTVRSLKTQIDQAQSLKKQADREALPQVSLAGTFSNARYTNGLPANAYTQASVGLVLNLSGLWTARGRSNAFDSIAEQRRSQLRQQVQEKENEFYQLDKELSLIQEQKPILKERYELAARSRAVSNAKLRLGRISFLELQMVEQSLFSAGQEQVLTLTREQQLRLRKEMTALFSGEYSRKNTTCPLAN